MGKDHCWRTLEPARDLTKAERALLDFLLSKRFPGRDALREQAKTVRVRGECGCGCASIEFAVDESKVPRAKVRRRIPIEAQRVIDEYGSGTYVLLHVLDGYIAYLEVFRVGTETATGIPGPETLELFSLDT